MRGRERGVGERQIIPAPFERMIDGPKTAGACLEK